MIEYEYQGKFFDRIRQLLNKYDVEKCVDDFVFMEFCSTLIDEFPDKNLTEADCMLCIIGAFMKKGGESPSVEFVS